MGLLLAAFAIVVVLALGLWAVKRSEIERLVSRINTLNREAHKLPDGARVYFDRYLLNKCKRCGKGEILRRFRFLVASCEEGGTVLQELEDHYWCESCSFRGVNPQ